MNAGTRSTSEQLTSRQASAPRISKISRRTFTRLAVVSRTVVWRSARTDTSPAKAQIQAIGGCLTPCRTRLATLGASSGDFTAAWKVRDYGMPGGREDTAKQASSTGASGAAAESSVDAKVCRTVRASSCMQCRSWLWLGSGAARAASAVGTPCASISHAHARMECT